MGWSWRKSIAAGPVRLNLSRSGVGVSAGVRGARVSVGPRGTYIHVGRGGFRYTKRLAGPGQVPASPAPPPPRATPTPTGNLRDVELVDPASLAPSDAEELLAEIRAKRSKIGLTPVLSGIAVLGLGVGLGLLLAGVPPWIGLGALALAGVAIAFVPRARWRDRRECWVKAQYVLDPLGTQLHDDLTRLLDLLAQTHVIWSVRQADHHGDWKRNSGAGVSIGRSRVPVAFGPPPRFRTNVRVGSLLVGGNRLYFLPDLVLVYGRGSTGAVRYGDLRVEQGTTNFVEDGVVPRDATVIGQTWRYVNKNGTPDRRFANNYQMPIVDYGRLGLRAQPGLELELQTSSRDAAREAADLLERVRSLCRQIESSKAPGGGDVAPPPGREETDELPPILGSGVARRAWEAISFDWPSRLPDWAVPIVWGIAIALPLATLIIRLLGGAGTMPAWALVAAFAAAGGILARPLIGLPAGWAQGVREGREARRSRLVALLVSELTTRPRREFDYARLVADSGSSRREADRAADVVYRRMADRAVDDGVVTDAEQRRLDLLAGTLEMSPERAAGLLKDSKEARYDRAVSEALADGVVTREEARSLDLLRTSLDME